ncbi:MAG: hypothetical protein KAI43_04300 [Candidatus Aureabacteria bacterium]|nr:hypothetical protein [Candidatus Auribacterota bacterium]
MKKVFLLLITVCLLLFCASDAKADDFGSYKIDFPLSYSAPEIIDNSPTKLVLVMGQLRADGSQSSMLINEIDISKFPPERQANIPEDPFKNFDDYLGTIRQRYVNFKRSEVTKVDVNGVLFARATWTGTINHPEYGSFNMQGLVYIHRKGNMVYQINFMDYAQHANNSIEKAESAFKTFQFK